MLEAFLEHFFAFDLLTWLHTAPWFLIALGLVVGVLMLGKSADVLVDEATELSLKLGMPRVIVGATIVSLGTTTPEAVVSVMAAIGGTPGLALGNAVGSIICDTGLILGVACLIAPIPLDRWLVNRQGMVQFGAGLLLIGMCVPWTRLGTMMTEGGVLPQWGGFMFLGLLAVYVLWSIHVAKSKGVSDEPSDDSGEPEAVRSTVGMVFMLLVATFFVVVSSEILISAAIETAARLNVPEGVIAATLVAFGTSLPELTIAVTASLKGRGELAIGNVIGADILNVLFVAGAAAAVTPVGLNAAPEFFRVQFPAMLAVLITFRVAIMCAKGDQLPRWAGGLLVGFYFAYLGFSFVMR
ncbi:calcium/sodium antiporter [Rosistilla oblonga]|uniref:calcium/sodium antiporter n=1 Tax=Rosistilla oblonga TaxID=2527990 RepID=UPI003A97EDE4